VDVKEALHQSQLSCISGNDCGTIQFPVMIRYSHDDAACMPCSSDMSYSRAAGLLSQPHASKLLWNGTTANVTSFPTTCSNCLEHRTIRAYNNLVWQTYTMMHFLVAADHSCGAHFRQHRHWASFHCSSQRVQAGTHHACFHVAGAQDFVESFWSRAGPHRPCQR